MRRLPKYACIQTIDRTYYLIEGHRPGESCDQMSADRHNGRQKLDLQITDRLRLDVAQGLGREMHSWPGASRFDMADVDRIVDRGPISSGSLGGYLVDIFENEGTAYDYLGEKTRANTRVLVFGYRVELPVSHYEIRSSTGWTPTAYSGTFEVDPRSLSLKRLVIETPELPSETTLCQASSTLDYGPTQIGDGTFLLPQASELHLLLRAGVDTINHIVFSGCREYQAESQIQFDSRPAPSREKPKPPETGEAFPPGLSMEVRLNAPIDTDDAAAGDAVTAMVLRSQRLSGNNLPEIKPGAIVHGRIKRLEHHFLPQLYFLVGFEWQSMEYQGERRRLYATIDTESDFGTRALTGQPRPIDPNLPPPPAQPRVRIVLPPPGCLLFQSSARHFTLDTHRIIKLVTTLPPK